MPLTLQLPHRQAGVLNHLSRELTAGHQAARIIDMQHETGADTDTCETLCGNGYLTLKTIDREPTTRTENAHWAATTRKGRRWVQDDPVNRLLVAVYNAPNRRLRLTHAAEDLGEQVRGTVVDVLKTQLLTLHYTGDGRETRLQHPRDGVAEFRTGRDYDLRLTNDARTRLAI